MIPSGFVVMDRFPLMPNGKVDRQALPAPRLQTLTKVQGYSTTPTETAMQEIWAEVLGIARRVREENFFELGGHSLKATQVLSRLQDRLQKELALRDIFNNPIAALSALLDQQIDIDQDRLQYRMPRIIRSPMRSTPLVSVPDGRGEAYHMVDSLRVGDSLIETSAFCTRLCHRPSESLRTSFFERDGNVAPAHREARWGAVGLVDLSDAPYPLEQPQMRP